MTESKHTPAPWEVDGLAIDASQYEVAVCSQGLDEDENQMPREEAEANAKLISAAPELLEACKCALADLEGLRAEGIFYEDEGKPPQVETIEELQAAIKKAGA